MTQPHPGRWIHKWDWRTSPAVWPTAQGMADIVDLIHTLDSQIEHHASVIERQQQRILELEEKANKYDNLYHDAGLEHLLKETIE